MAGNQTCTRMPNELRLRVLPALEAQYGSHVFLPLPPIRFAYGQVDIEAAWGRGEAITYRFLRRERKGRAVWYVQATVERLAVPCVTDRRRGAIGIDFNPTHIDAAEIDRFGNPIGTRAFPVDLAKCSAHQVALAEVATDLVAGAKTAEKPLVHEELDFRKKKAGLGESSPRAMPGCFQPLRTASFFTF